MTQPLRVLLARTLASASTGCRTVTVAVILAATVFAAAEAEGKPLDQVSISLFSGIAFAPVVVAIDKGYFRDEGIDPQLVFTPLGTDSISMTANGQTDIGATATGVSLFNAGFRGLDFKITASMAVHPAPTTITPLMIRKDLWDAGIRSARDLKGKAISTNSPGGSIEYKLELIMEKYGMTIADVREIGIGLPETLLAFQNKAIDAAVLGEPFATEAARRGLAVIDVEDSKVAAGDLGTVIIYSKAFITKRHDVAVRAMRAMARGARDLQPNNWKTKDNIDIFTKRFKLAPETIEAMAFPVFEPTLEIAKYIPSLKHQAEIHAKDKRMPAAAVASIGPTIDETFVTEAAAKK
ncbi:ABC transporter substrate-binding protein [Beijerinckia sp. L45]|uniref:ABC transporter substrate-binding protein n=1 Tax=Beijerinckia sp. L45 TaxID=1641855 RepID=UPI00131BF149|nr:ABC transporter substrate-binding protein [Beijerinckia sp. L45]